MNGMMIREIATVVAVALASVAGACDGSPGARPESAPDRPSVRVDPEIGITPMSGRPGSNVTVRASGFEAGDRVDIGVGPPRSEYEILTRAEASQDGTLTATVPLPEWVEAGRAYVFVAVGPDGGTAISGEFRVNGEDGMDTIRITGRLTDEGVECPALRTEDGALYTLAGETGGFEAGDRVVVDGTIMEMSVCMQGTTITVERIRAAG